MYQKNERKRKAEEAPRRAACRRAARPAPRVDAGRGGRYDGHEVMNMATQVLKIEGMSCGHCKQAVEGALKGLAGVSAVTVDLDRGEATVEYDPAQASTEAMKGAVEQAGYKVVEG